MVDALLGGAAGREEQVFDVPGGHVVGITAAVVVGGLPEPPGASPPHVPELDGQVVVVNAAEAEGGDEQDEEEGRGPVQQQQPEGEEGRLADRPPPRRCRLRLRRPCPGDLCGRGGRSARAPVCAAPARPLVQGTPRRSVWATAGTATASAGGALAGRVVPPLRAPHGEGGRLRGRLSREWAM